MKALALDQRAYRQQYGGVCRQSEPLADCLPLHAVKSHGIDTIAHHHDLLTGHPETRRMALERLRYGEDSRRPLHAPDHPTAPACIVRKRHFSATQRDAHRNAQPAAEQRRRVAFRIGEVGVDEVATEAALEAKERRQTTHRHAKAIKPLECARHRQKPRSPHLDRLLHLHGRCRGPEMGFPPAQRPLKRKPGCRGDDGQGK